MSSRGGDQLSRTAVRRRSGESGGEGQRQHHWRNYGLRWLLAIRVRLTVDRYWLCRGTAGKPPLSVHGLWLRGNRTRTSRLTPCASWTVECRQHSPTDGMRVRSLLHTTENLPRPRAYRRSYWAIQSCKPSIV